MGLGKLVGLEQVLEKDLCLNTTKEVGEGKGKQWGLSSLHKESLLEQKLPPPPPAAQAFCHHPPASCAASSDPSSQHALPLRHLGPGKFLLKPSRSSSKFPPLRSLPIPPAGGGSCCSLMSRQPAESGLWRQTRPGSPAPAV